MKKHGRVSTGNIHLPLVAALLGITGLAKLFSPAGEARVLAVRGPLSLLSGRQVLSSVRLLELAVVAGLVSARNVAF